MTGRGRRGKMGVEKPESLLDDDEASWRGVGTRPQWWKTTWNEELPCRRSVCPQS